MTFRFMFKVSQKTMRRPLTHKQYNQLQYPYTGDVNTFVRLTKQRNALITFHRPGINFTDILKKSCEAQVSTKYSNLLFTSQTCNKCTLWAETFSLQPQLCKGTTCFQHAAVGNHLARLLDQQCCLHALLKNFLCDTRSMRSHLSVINWCNFLTCFGPCLPN